MIKSHKHNFVYNNTILTGANYITAIGEIVVQRKKEIFLAYSCNSYVVTLEGQFIVAICCKTFFLYETIL